VSAPATCSDDHRLHDDSPADPLPASSGSGDAPIAVPPTRKLLAPRSRTLKLRARPPKDSKVRKLVHITLALRAQGLTYADIAEQTGKTVNTIKTYMHKANREGWIDLESFSDPEDRLDVVLRSQAVKNIHDVLSEKVGNPYDELQHADQPSKRALDASMEIAKGTGMLKQHQAIKSESMASVGMALKVQVEMPNIPASSVQIRPGSVGGSPAFDAEIIEQE
jgi:sigma-70-like protein